MARGTLDQARTLSPEQPEGRTRLTEIYRHTLYELCSVISDGLKDELRRMFVPIADREPTLDELRLAQAQLVA